MCAENHLNVVKFMRRVGACINMQTEYYLIKLLIIIDIYTVRFLFCIKYENIPFKQCRSITFILPYGTIILEYNLLTRIFNIFVLKTHYTNYVIFNS